MVCHTGEIVRRLLGHCRETEEGVADAAVDRFLEEHGNSSRVSERREGGRDKKILYAYYSPAIIVVSEVSTASRLNAEIVTGTELLHVQQNFLSCLL